MPLRRRSRTSFQVVHRPDDLGPDLLDPKRLEGFPPHPLSPLGDPAVQLRIADNALGLGNRLRSARTSASIAGGFLAVAIRFSSWGILSTSGENRNGRFLSKCCRQLTSIPLTGKSPATQTTTPRIRGIIGTLGHRKVDRTDARGQSGRECATNVFCLGVEPPCSQSCRPRPWSASTPFPSRSTSTSTSRPRRCPSWC